MRWLREPLLHFLVLGAGLFVLFGMVGERETEAPKRVSVTAQDVERLAGLWERRWQRPPTPRELDGLIEESIREEILSREAVALGLDTDDTIVRRRLAQKMEFLSQDLLAQAEPTDEELRAFLAEHRQRFENRPASASPTCT